MLELDDVVSALIKLDDPVGSYAQWRTRISRKQAAGMVSINAKVRCKLQGNALRLVAGRQANTIVDVVKILDGAYGEVRGIDQSAFSKRFHTEKYDPKEMGLEEWVAEKHALALKLPEQIPPGPVFEASMKHVLLDLLPPHFHTVVNELRSTPGKSWKMVEARLVDYDKSARQDDQEVQGQVFQTKVALSTAGDRIHKLEKQVQQLTALLAKTSNQKPKNVKKQVKTVKKCWGCGAEGHTRLQCKNKKNNKQKKGHGKGRA